MTDDEDESYFWKDRQRQLDPDSRRFFEGGVWITIAGIVLAAIVAGFFALARFAQHAP